MITGTHHFTGFKAAVRYYADYGLTNRDVEVKIQKGEIALGPPKDKKTFIKEGRYFTEE